VRLPSQHCGLGPVVLSPGDSECEPVSRRDRLWLTLNLTTRALWPSPETSGAVGYGKGKAVPLHAMEALGGEDV
jgi:hypothetical protein